MVSICSPTSSACALQTSNTVGNNCRIGNPQQWERQLYALLVVDSANKIGERISKGEGIVHLQAPCRTGYSTAFWFSHAQFLYFRRSSLHLYPKNLLKVIQQAFRTQISGTWITWNILRVLTILRGRNRTPRLVTPFKTCF